jgi:diguanylate cyclase (GGDEF)-like protein
VSFDIPTVLALSIACALLSATILHTSNARDPAPGMREAIVATLALAVGYALQLFRNAIGPSVAIVTSNGLFWLAGVFIHRACRSFEGQRSHPRLPLVIVGAGVALFVAFVSSGTPYGTRAIATSVLCAATIAPALYDLAKNGGLRREPSRKLMFWLLATTGMALLVRVVLLIPHFDEDSQTLTPALERTIAFVPSLVFSQGFGLAFVLMHRERSAALARELAMTDALTGCLNRRALEKHAASELAHALRHGRPCSVVIVDLDHFKKINDIHGHAAGDAVLTETGALLRGAVRPGDVVARFGGEEFCVLLRETNLDRAGQAAERLRSLVEAKKVATDTGDIALSASFGVAAFEPSTIDPAEREPWPSLFKRADEALYRSKQGGRNRVSLA